MQNLKLGVWREVMANPWRKNEAQRRGMDNWMGKMGEGPIRSGKMRQRNVPKIIIGWKQPRRSMRMPQMGELDIQIREVKLRSRPVKRDGCWDNWMKLKYFWMELSEPALNVQSGMHHRRRGQIQRRIRITNTMKFRECEKCTKGWHFCCHYYFVVLQWVLSYFCHLYLQI